MTASLKRPGPGADSARLSSVRLALICARHVHAAVDRRMPEARALTSWLVQHAAAFDLPASAIPEDDDGYLSPRRSVSAADWRKIGAALQTANQQLPSTAGAPAGSWVDAIRTALGARCARSPHSRSRPALQA